MYCRKAKDGIGSCDKSPKHVFTCDDDVHSILPFILEEDSPLLDEPNLCDIPQVGASQFANPSQTIDIAHGELLPITTVEFPYDTKCTNDDNKHLLVSNIPLKLVIITRLLVSGIIHQS